MSEFLKFIIKEAIEEYDYETISRLQIIKIAFLIDYFWDKQYGMPFSSYEYTKESLGPYSKEIIISLTDFVRQGVLVNTENYYTYKINHIESKKSIADKLKKLDKLDSIFKMGKDESLDLIRDKRKHNVLIVTVE